MERYRAKPYREMSIRLLTLLIGLLLLSPVNPPCFGQQPKQDFRRLEAMALKELKETNTPGAAIAIVSGDKIVYAKGLGLANMETLTPVSPEMLFRIGSITKVFTAVLLVGLAEERGIKLSEPIGNYVKGLN